MLDMMCVAMSCVWRVTFLHLEPNEVVYLRVLVCWDAAWPKHVCPRLPVIIFMHSR